MNKISKPQTEQQPRPDVVRGDRVYFLHKSGPRCGTVKAAGQAGCVIDSVRERYRVPWHHVIGHHTRSKLPGAKVTHDGEDGAIAQLPSGRTLFLRYGGPDD